MKFTISRQHLKQLLDWASAAGEEECCGLLLAGDGIQLTENVATDRQRHFEIDPKALIAAEKAARGDGPDIIGYFHSHPGGLTRPSAEDEAMAIADGRTWLIIAEGAVTAWRKDRAAGFTELPVVIEG